MKDNELIVCRDVSLGYEGKSVLTDLNLTIAKGDYLCVVGDNGSGKSTLIRGLLGLIQPQGGTIEHAPALKHGAIGYLPPADPGPAGFPRHRAGGGALRLPEPSGAALFLHSGPAVRGHDEPGQAGDSGAEGRLLPGSLRRTAAAGAIGPRPCAPPASF